MILHCTKKLYAKLPESVKEAEPATSAISTQAHWLTKKDFANLDWHFNDVFINTLLKNDMPPELVNVAATNYQPLTFDTIFNRSVQGTMNQAAQDIDYGFYYNRASVADICAHRYSANLNHRPCGVKGQKDYIWPDKEMAKLLLKLSTKIAVRAVSTSLH